MGPAVRLPRSTDDEQLICRTDQNELLHCFVSKNILSCIDANQFKLKNMHISVIIFNQ